jgi:hypothetical protein
VSGSLRPRLVLLQGEHVLDVREIPIDGEWILGRRADSPVPLGERSVSRQHARVFCEAASVYIEDLGSPNGTWVDGRPLQGVAALRDGNVLRLGQSTNPTPLLLRFEDPGARLLEALSERPPAPLSSPPVPADEPTLVPGAPLAPLGEAEVPAPPEPASEEEALPPSSEPLVVAPVAQATALARRVRGRLGPRALGLAVLALVVLALVRYLPEILQKPWQSVEIEPVRIRAGGRVALRGSEVAPSSSLRITVDGQEARVEEMQPGQIVFTAPRLPAVEAGVRPVELRVERRRIVLVRQSLHYETTPDIAGVDPPEAEVGAVITLRGSGFTSEAGRVAVRVGGSPATVVEARPTTVKVRVPPVTRTGPVTVPVELTVAEWSAEPASLLVRPRTAPCLALRFAALPAAPRVWALRHSLGPAVLVEGGPAGADGSPPPPVRRALRALEETFAAAASDPGLRFEARASGRESRLVAVGREGAREVGRWGPAVTAHVREAAGTLARPELLPYWSALVLNAQLDVLVKKLPPRLLPAGARLQPVLERLHRLSLETGGQGCPAEEEIATLTPEERAAFEGALVEAPADYGDLAGAWEGQLENVFKEDPGQAQLDLRLEIAQEGTALELRVFVYEVRGPGIRWAPPAIGGVKGRVRLGAETRVELDVPARPPYLITRGSGTLVDGVLEGTFRTSRGREARFRLERAGR